MHLLRLDATDLAGVVGYSRKERGGIMRVEPIECPSQTLVSAQISGDPPPQHVFHRLVRNVLRHEIRPTMAEAPSIEDHRWCRRSHAHLLPIRRVLLISPGGQTDLLAHSRHDSSVIQPFIHSALCCLHLAPSSVLDPTLPHSHIPVNELLNVGSHRLRLFCSDSPTSLTLLRCFPCSAFQGKRIGSLLVELIEMLSLPCVLRPIFSNIVKSNLASDRNYAF